MKRFLKTISAAIIFTAFSLSASAVDVIPSGECVGIKLYTDGLIITDTAVVTERDGTKKNLAKGYNLEKGDVITKINGSPVVSNEMFIDTLNETAGDVELTVRRGDATREVTVTPADTSDGRKLGLWLRDSTAGLGTITCYAGNRFAALGHGICDVDTGNIMPLGHGIIQGSKITALLKSENGAPGAISGEINGEFLGTITSNSENGLFGRLTRSVSGTPVTVAAKDEVKCDNATILADVDGSGVREYSIRIKRISVTTDGRDMVIKITDPALIEKTGGIVQGMSGAPIIQNNKLVGAVTHVFVNDAQSGYAILAENLLRDMI